MAESLRKQLSKLELKYSLQTNELTETLGELDRFKIESIAKTQESEDMLLAISSELSDERAKRIAATNR